VISMKYKYQSNWSGELQPNLFKVIKETINNIKGYPFEWTMLSWKYNRRGW
jgi:hypothetical protein